MRKRTIAATAGAALLLVLIGIALGTAAAWSHLILPASLRPTSNGGPGAAAEAHLDSPRLAALARALAAGDAEADRLTLERFWRDVQGEAPLVEPDPDGDGRWSLLTFLWRGDPEARRVHVLNGPALTANGVWLTRLGDTDVWFRTERAPSDAHFMYWVQVNWPACPPRDFRDVLPLLRDCPLRRDPLNPRRGEGEFGASIVELTDAPPRPWPDPVAGAAAGTVAQHKFASRTLGEERSLFVYTPPNYAADGAACDLLLLFDGDGHADKNMPIPVILDHLIATKRIPPTVAVFVCSGAKRDDELSCSEPFAHYLARELVPWARDHYRVSREAARTTVGGASSGGLMAGYCALRHPDTFGNVLSLSGAYYWCPGMDAGTAPPDAETGWLTRQFATAPRKPVNVYLAVGRFEVVTAINLLAENRRLRDVLEVKGYPVRYHEYSGGHDAIGWRGALVNGLVELSRMRDAAPR